MQFHYPYRIYPLGDHGICLDLGNIIDPGINQQVISIFQALQNEPLTGMREAVPAYSSLTIYYDALRLKSVVPPGTTIYAWMKIELEKRLAALPIQKEETSRLIKIPVCYEEEFATDIKAVEAEKNITIPEIVRLHTEVTYRVYMLGFLPGFAYMGSTDERIAMPRLSNPRQRVEAGSVGITGRQTGIYPLNSPGGWQIIGRTPMKLFDAGSSSTAGLCLLHPGDTVTFYPISKHEFESY